MQLRRILVAVLAVFILAGGALAPRCQAATLVSFTDTDILSSAVAPLDATTVRYGSWTQTVSSTSTTIEAILRGEIGSQGHAWLVNQVGLGTTGTNVLAETNFNPPLISPPAFDLSSVPYTPLFTGLSLSPGTYYLVLRGLGSADIFNEAWLGDGIGVVVNSAPGFAVEPYGDTITSDPFAPAASFTVEHDAIRLFYRVEGDAVPVPGTLLLLGSGLVGLFGWRRRFQK